MKEFSLYQGWNRKGSVDTLETANHTAEALSLENPNIVVSVRSRTALISQWVNGRYEDCTEKLAPSDFKILEGKYFKEREKEFFKIRTVEITTDNTKVLSISTVNYQVVNNRLIIDYNGHQTRELDFDFSALKTDKEELMQMIKKVV